MPDWLETHPSAVAAAVALGVLWLAESVAPFFVRRDGRTAHGSRNLALGMINGLLRASFFPAALLVVVAWSQGERVGLLHQVALPLAVEALLAVLALDLSAYAWHVASHKWKFLWRFHAVHHHDTEVDSTTALRFHAGDVLASAVVTLGVVALFGLGVEHVLLYEAVLLPASVFHHANIRIPERLDRALRAVIVTPRMHWVHHSRWVGETDSNYSGLFSFWDRLFGTFVLRGDPARIDIGLDGYEHDDHATVRGCLATPFGPLKSEPGTPPRSAARTLGPCPTDQPRTTESAALPARG